MHVCISVHACVYVVCVHVCVYACVCACSVCEHVYACKCACSVCACIYIYMYMHACVPMCWMRAVSEPELSSSGAFLPSKKVLLRQAPGWAPGEF